MGTILDRIVEHKREELRELKSKLPQRRVEARLSDAPRVRSLKESLSRNETLYSWRENSRAELESEQAACEVAVRVIAECKKASPSQGVLRVDYNPALIARSYQEHGAAAVSCLTDRKFFQGSLDDLQRVRERLDIPLLRKEFVIDEYQIFEARAAGADAVLLICSILAARQLRDYIALIRELRMDALVEIYELNEIENAVLYNTGIVGVNNRDLRNFEVDLNRTALVAKELPGDLLLVSESGIRTRDDIEIVMQAGARAILIGEALMKAPDPGTALAELLGAPSRSER